jgi:hypothetical protein
MDGCPLLTIRATAITLETKRPILGKDTTAITKVIRRVRDMESRHNGHSGHSRAEENETNIHTHVCVIRSRPSLGLLC